MRLFLANIGRIEMRTKFFGYLETFSDYYQATITRRLVVGLVIGILVWICIFAFALVLGIFVENNLWLKTVQLDLPGIGGIIALLVTFQIWGLLPQPSSDVEEYPSSTDSNTKNEDVVEELSNTETVETEKKLE